MAKPHNATAAASYATEQTGPQIGGIVLTKVVREHIPLFGGSGGTFGDAVDQALSQAAGNGEEVQSFEVQITDDYWREYAMNLTKVEPAY